MFETAVTWLVGVLWSTPMLFLVLGVGIWFTIRLGVPQLRRIPEMLRYLVGGGDSTRGVSSFQAFAMALGGRVGVGNIAGVATAINAGGPGALFWMWITATIGAAIAVVESSLAQAYKEEINGEYRGGPAYYIERGLGWRWLAVAYAIAASLAFAVTGPSIQSFNIATSAQAGLGIDPVVSGVVVAALFCAVIFGGLKRIGTVCGLVVPFMAAAYILIGLVIVALNAPAIPGMITHIFAAAFGADAAFGGMLGAAIMWGVRRAVYSSEVGIGSGAQASAAAEVSHPVKQGLAQGFSVYVDTLFVCTMTGLMILVTDSYNVVGADGVTLIAEYAPGLEAGPAYTQAAIDAVFPGFGSVFIAIAMFFFAFTTLLSFGFYADTNIAYLMRGRRGERAVVTVVQLVLAGSIVLGAFRSSELAWAIADVGVGLFAWINLIALVLLSPKAITIYADYERQRRAGLDPVFDPDALGLRGALVWREVAARRTTAPTDADPGR
ncbi:alanine/glycine:cation symporter family protein [Propioniciclava soli]|uniref:alanine/glycine:cation symporter family protein n=1 Tax=Propioniciclava soli TaxID=2775081 RepID=UPI001E628B6A|nr:alanine/glycine:cation symporter family protein [Propioniciclava soli]